MRRAFHMMALLLAFACKNEEDATPESDPPTEPAYPTEVGIPIGTVTTATIGANGGALLSDDGLLEVHVPAGAVAANTSFSVQPLVGFCPGGISTYRLLPAGQRFSQPIELVFRLPGEVNPTTSPEIYGVAFQDAEGVWYTMPDPVVDVAAKTVRVEVMHFTDWTAIEFIKITPSQDPIELSINQTTNLLIVGQGVSADDKLPPLPARPTPASTDPNEDELPPLPQDDELPPLPPPHPFKVKWYVNDVENGNDQVGRITVNNPSELLYTYKAPAKVPFNSTVVVRAELTNMKQWKTKDGKRTIKNHVKLILLKQIHIRPDEYKYSLNVTIRSGTACGYDGQTQDDAVEMDVLVKDGKVTIDNIVNHNPTVSPGSINFQGCLITCSPGSKGEINVTSAEGVTSEVGAQYAELRITLKHTQLNFGKVTTLVCGSAPPIVSESLPFDNSEVFPFALADSAQTIGGSSGPNSSYLAKLIPKE